MAKSDGRTETQLLIDQLIDKGIRLERIALDLEVSYPTVLRWKTGGSTPHPGHLSRLERLVEKHNK